MADIKEALAKKQEKAVYTGTYRILNKNASPIAWDGQMYSPKDESEIAELEYQVKLGRVTKS